ncbi:MAG TPA: nitrogenase component 1, partial [Enhygromyxa sp.]|nr:nitrogenase component 1 [Enhygromyxa sp.]
LARATEREAEAEALITAELRGLLPRLEWLVPSVLLGRTLAFSGDPTLFDGLLDGMSELGVEVAYLAASARRPANGCVLDEEVHGALPPVTFAAPRTTVARHLAQLEAQLDVVVGGTHTPIFERTRQAVAWIEFGFPSFFRHALVDCPFLGFRGWAWFVQEVANAVMARPRA